MTATRALTTRKPPQMLASGIHHWAAAFSVISGCIIHSTPQGNTVQCPACSVGICLLPCPTFYTFNQPPLCCRGQWCPSSTRSCLVHPENGPRMTVDKRQFHFTGQETKAGKSEIAYWRLSSPGEMAQGERITPLGTLQNKSTNFFNRWTKNNLADVARFDLLTNISRCSKLLPCGW